MNEINFTVRGPPVPWKRARRRGKQYYTDDKVANQKDLVALACRAARDSRELWSGPVVMRMIFCIPMPKSWSDKKKTAKHLKPHTQKPDGDNLAKLVCDALNGVLYVDDAQVCSVMVHKVWTVDGQTAIEAREIDGDTYLSQSLGNGWQG